MDDTYRELKAAEYIVDELIQELDALNELTARDGRISKLIDKVWSNFSKTPYFEMLQERMASFEKTSKKKGKTRNKSRDSTSY